MVVIKGVLRSGPSSLRLSHRTFDGPMRLSSWALRVRQSVKSWALDQDHNRRADIFTCNHLHRRVTLAGRLLATLYILEATDSKVAHTQSCRFRPTIVSHPPPEM